MTIPPAQNTELIPGANRDVYFTLFSYLSPQDLRSCSDVCQSLRQRVTEFNAPERLARFCTFVAEVMATPRKAHIDSLSNIYRAILQQRDLTPEEFEQLRPWITSQDTNATFRDLSHLNLRFPGPKQLFAVCTGPAAGDKKALLYDITGEFLNRETQACYRSITQMACELLRIMGPRENEGYVSPVTRAQTALTESKGQKLPQSDIEEAVWFLVSNLSRQEIADAEETCRTLVQVELAKLDPQEVEKMGQTLKKTFSSFKQLVEIYQKIETSQSKAVREGQYKRAADEADNFLLAAPQEPTAFRGIVRILGGLCLSGILVKNLDSSLFAISKEYLGITIASIFFLGAYFATIPIGVKITTLDLRFQNRTEIRQDDSGAEVVHIIPHPLRGRVSLCCDLISAATIAYCAFLYFSWINNN